MQGFLVHDRSFINGENFIKMFIYFHCAFVLKIIIFSSVKGGFQVKAKPVFQDIFSLTLFLRQGR